MTIHDEGKTHHFGDDCPGGHRAACVAGVDWDDQETADEANARDVVEQEFADLALAARDKHVFVNVTTCACGFQPPMSSDWERHRMGAVLAAVVPLIRAQVQAEADAREERAWHRGFESARRHTRITPAVPRTFAAPVTVRIAEDFHEPDEPVTDVVAAFEMGEKGVTRRPPGWCRWHQMVDCHGDAPECREARAEIGGGGDRG